LGAASKLVVDKFSNDIRAETGLPAYDSDSGSKSDWGAASKGQKEPRRCRDIPIPTVAKSGWTHVFPVAIAVDRFFIAAHGCNRFA
jgi:hypothetical protein